MQCEQPEAFALIAGRLGAFRRDPMLDDFLADPEQFVRRSDGIVGAYGIDGLLEFEERPHARPFSFSSGIDFEMFSWTPTFLGLSPRASPSSCVKYMIFTSTFSPNRFSARI